MQALTCLLNCLSISLTISALLINLDYFDGQILGSQTSVKPIYGIGMISQRPCPDPCAQDEALHEISISNNTQKRRPTPFRKFISAMTHSTVMFWATYLLSGENTVIFGHKLGASKSSSLA
jgi:hypothetical protein